MELLTLEEVGNVDDEASGRREDVGDELGVGNRDSKDVGRAVERGTVSSRSNTMVSVPPSLKAARAAATLPPMLLTHMTMTLVASLTFSGRAI